MGTTISKCTSLRSEKFTARTKLENVLQNLPFQTDQDFSQKFDLLKKYLSVIQVFPLDLVNIGRGSCFGGIKTEYPVSLCYVLWLLLQCCGVNPGPYIHARQALYHP